MVILLGCLPQEWSNNWAPAPTPYIMNGLFLLSLHTQGMTSPPSSSPVSTEEVPLPSLAQNLYSALNLYCSYCPTLITSPSPPAWFPIFCLTPKILHKLRPVMSSLKSSIVHFYLTLKYSLHFKSASRPYVPLCPTPLSLRASMTLHQRMFCMWESWINGWIHSTRMCSLGSWGMLEKVFPGLQ